MKSGYNARIQKKIAKRDSDWDAMYWLWLRIGKPIYLGVDREAIKRAIKIYKFQMGGRNRNFHYKATRLHELSREISVLLYFKHLS